MLDIYEKRASTTSVSSLIDTSPKRDLDKQEEDRSGRRRTIFDPLHAPNSARGQAIAQIAFSPN